MLCFVSFFLHALALFKSTERQERGKENDALKAEVGHSIVLKKKKFPVTRYKFLHYRT